MLIEKNSYYKGYFALVPCNSHVYDAHEATGASISSGENLRVYKIKDHFCTSESENATEIFAGTIQLAEM